ncbi:MAG: prephenate dehydrogenase [Anaerolineae bacterium]
MFPGEEPLPAGCSVAIVGLGLMGGSLAAALKQRCPSCRVLGSARRGEVLTEALARGWIDEALASAPEAVAQADLVVLALPVRSIVAQVAELAGWLQPGAVLTDIGSTKRAVLAAMDAVAAAPGCVGGHPMCGRERRGLAAGDARLYEGATWAVCGGRASAPQSVQRVAALARTVGARPLLIDAAKHDAVVAATSHLPYAVAAALARTVAHRVGDEELAALSAGGYRDTTRLAASSPEMMLDILATNRDEVLPLLRGMRDELGLLVSLLEGGSADDSALAAYMRQARSDRRLP